MQRGDIIKVDAENGLVGVVLRDDGDTVTFTTRERRSITLPRSSHTFRRVEKYDSWVVREITKWLYDSMTLFEETKVHLNRYMNWAAEVRHG